MSPRRATSKRPSNGTKRLSSPYGNTTRSAPKRPFRATCARLNRRGRASTGRKVTARLRKAIRLAERRPQVNSGIHLPFSILHLPLLPLPENWTLRDYRYEIFVHIFGTD